LNKQHYAIVGKNSGVKVCEWTKKSICNEGHCYKQDFYGIESHRCCQMSPALVWCQNKCLHCWRAIEHTQGDKLSECDSPKEIIEGVIAARKKLLNGFWGNEKADKKKLKEAEEPTLFTFSLSGEPTLYPDLAGLIKEVRKRKAVSFLVTNGLCPEKILELEKKKSLPTQITVSTNAPNETLFKFWHRSSDKNAWKKFNETIDVLGKLKGKVRRVIRLTLVKSMEGESKISKLTNMSDENLKEYVEMIQRAKPDMIHVKAFKSLGFSRKRLPYEKGPFHTEIVEFSKKLEAALKKEGYKIVGEHERSCFVLLAKDKKMLKIKEV
jgi:tRNA wybutosine-synthesizing protein 1